MYPTNNGAALQQTGVENATQGSGNRYYLTESNLGRLVDPQYPYVSPPTWLHSEQPAVTEPNWAYMGNPGDQAIQSAMPQWPEEPIGTIPPMDPVAFLKQLLDFDEQCAKVAANRIQTGLALREELQKPSDHGVYKREPDPGVGVGPSQWMAESKGRGAADPPDRRHTKRRKIMEEGEIGDRAVAQRGKTQELHVRRTPTILNDKSKLGRGLEETLSVPLQGVYPPISLGSTVTGATLGLPDLEGQAWTKGEERISEGVEDEEETDGARCARLMYHEEEKWRCRGCDGKGFSDRSTLRRHCKTVHGFDRLVCPHPHCAKSYKRRSGLNRHIREKHSEVGGHS